MNFYDAESCLLFIYCFINELESTETIAISPIMINTEARNANRKKIFIQYSRTSMARFGLFHMRFKDINVIYLYITILIACINGYIWITDFCILKFYFRFWNFLVPLQLIESQCWTVYVRMYTCIIFMNSWELKQRIRLINKKYKTHNGCKLSRYVNIWMRSWNEKKKNLSKKRST